MTPPASSAQLLQNKISAAFLASQKRAPQQAETVAKMASQKADPIACQKIEQPPPKVKTPQGKGQKSKTVKINGLRLRVRLNDRSYRVMLLATDGEPYLCSLRLTEWVAVENDSAALLEKVKEKVRARVSQVSGKEKNKLQGLLGKLGGQENDK